jgi:hypothetical protein
MSRLLDLLDDFIYAGAQVLGAGLGYDQQNFREPTEDELEQAREVQRKLQGEVK